jgi:thiamine-phosphate pyrophosphorylase
MIDLRLYLVTDTALCGARGVPAVVGAAVEGGVTLVQVRDPLATARALTALTVEVLRVVDGRVPVVVNDRLDVALAAGADGVHVGQDDLDPQAVRAIAPGMVLGLSVRSVAEAAAATGVDYLGVGPVFATTTKVTGPALGLVGLAAACAATDLPTVAIGGLSAQTAADVRAAGAGGQCVVSAVCAARDPQVASADLRAAWERK